MNPFILLFAAIISEVFASSMLKATEGFKRLLPSIGVVAGYCLAFYFLSVSLKLLPLGMAYAIWSGLGTALTVLIGVTIYKENFNSKTFWGLALIIGGVILLNFSNEESHSI